MITTSAASPTASLLEKICARTASTAALVVRHVIRLKDWILDGSEYREIDAGELMLLARERVDALASESLPNISSAVACMSPDCGVIQHPAPGDQCIKCMSHGMLNVAAIIAKATRRIDKGKVHRIVVPIRGERRAFGKGTGRRTNEDES